MFCATQVWFAQPTASRQEAEKLQRAHLVGGHLDRPTKQLNKFIWMNFPETADLLGKFVGVSFARLAFHFFVCTSSEGVQLD